MNNASLVHRLQPRLMSLAIAILKKCEQEKLDVRLNVTTKDRFDILSVENGKPVAPKDEVKKIVSDIVGAKPNWASVKGTVVTTFETKIEASTEEKKSTKAKAE